MMYLDVNHADFPKNNFTRLNCLHNCDQDLVLHFIVLVTICIKADIV